MSGATYYARVGPDGRIPVTCPALAGCEVVIRARKAQRSVQANARYWALLTVAARELGYDSVEELHEGIAQRLLPLPELVPGVPRRKRTPTLNTAEFQDYTDAAERFFTIDLGLDLSGWREELDEYPVAAPDATGHP